MTNHVEPGDELGLQVDEALIAEIEEDLPPEEVEPWLEAFLRERVE